MPSFSSILVFVSYWNFMLSWVEHETICITSRSSLFRVLNRDMKKHGFLASHWVHSKEKVDAQADRIIKWSVIQLELSLSRLVRTFVACWQTLLTVLMQIRHYTLSRLMLIQTAWRWCYSWWIFFLKKKKYENIVNKKKTCKITQIAKN